MLTPVSGLSTIVGHRRPETRTLSARLTIVVVVVVVVAVLSTIWLSGCGGPQSGGPDPTSRRLAEVNTQLERFNEAYAAQKRRIDRVTERLELLEDRLEARLLHPPPSLPVVRLTPTESRAPWSHAVAHRSETRSSPSSTPATGPPSNEPAPAVLTQRDLDALDPGRPSSRRPESAPAERATSGRRRRKPVPPPAIAERAGNLGTVPLPGRGPRGGPAPFEATRPSQDDPVAAYKAAHALYVGGNLTYAVTALRSFVKRWPAHDYADNALFWLGECRLARAEYHAALRTFRRIIEEHPVGNKLPDALLKVGITLEKLGRRNESRDTLARLVAIYPGTDAASRASAHLDGARSGM